MTDHFTDQEPQTRPDGAGDQENWEPIRPFRLVKYFSFTGFIVIFVFTLALTIFISQQGKYITANKSEEYARLMADNLNHQVFLQFVIPAALQYGRIRLREPEQFFLLDTVVRNIIHSFNVQRVTIYDLEGTISYSTEKDLVGKKKEQLKPYEDALKGQITSFLITKRGKNLLGLDNKYTLRTFYPFRAERRLQGPVGEVLGVFEIDQDLTRDYAEIANFQFLSVAISLGFAALIFFILRQIIARGEKIIEERNEERRRLEEQLHHSERLANLGQMIAAVAHEIRNPLGIISSTAELLETKLKTYEPNNLLADVIVEESRRLNGIVTEFLDFARPQVPHYTSCRIEDVLDKILTFLGPEMDREGIEVQRDYQDRLGIDADPDLLYRALLNVLNNSIQAMPEGGTISVKTRLLNGTDAKSPDRIEVEISDTGEGIDPEKAKNLFNPFFTTKNRGTGLGLAIVKNIIDEHLGQVAIEPGPEIGTRLIIRLPLTQED